MEDKLSLSSLSKEELLQTMGGYKIPAVCITSTGCTCGCNYSDQGGSSTEDNCRANGAQQE